MSEFEARRSSTQLRRDLDVWGVIASDWEWEPHVDALRDFVLPCLSNARLARVNLPPLRGLAGLLELCAT